MEARMLAPAVVLVLWSIVMLFWTALSRLPAMKKIGASVHTARPGGRGSQLDGVLPDAVMWKSHNYTHLMEQPTIFYPTVVILALMGAGAGDVAIAWSYVALRIVHSLWQATVNKLRVRFALFILSTMCLIFLAIRAFALTVLA